MRILPRDEAADNAPARKPFSDGGVFRHKQGELHRYSVRKAVGGRLPCRGGKLLRMNLLRRSLTGPWGDLFETKLRHLPGVSQ
jgi:hypothetical protein